MRAKKNVAVDALLVGYENQENLGLRSILAYLHEQGQKGVLMPFCPGRHGEVLAAVERFRPRLVGFSLIFQHTLDEFGSLMRYLRTQNVQAHFTAGGHFPSLRPHQTLELLPELDSVVRFEGELILSELLERLDQPDDWEHIQGLAFRKGAETVLNPLRPPVANLDLLPPVYRDEPTHVGQGLRTASMLASRGCLFNCSFCSIRQFYGALRGPLRRVRSPQAVVDEMLSLFTRCGVRYFSFQDDDFAARTKQQREWLYAFLDILARAELANQVQWKISCRVDDLEPEILTAMTRHGLMGVYLGVESGNAAGLSTLNKRVCVTQNLSAVSLLKQHNVAMAMGFMLFDPSSTMDTIRENLDFLHAVGADGYFPINFCKMLPYAGTPIEATLLRAGRLKGTPIQPDYGYLDPSVEAYEYLVKRIFTRKNFSREGLVALLQEADFDYRLERAFGLVERAKDYGTALRQLICRSNLLTLQTLRALHDEIVSSGSEFSLQEQEAILEIADREWRGEAAIKSELKRLKETLPSHEDSTRLTSGLGRSCVEAGSGNA